MIYTAKLEQEGRTILLASVDGENYFSINWEPRPEDEDDIRELLTPKSKGDPPYLGFKKDYLRGYDAIFDTLGS